MVGHHIFEKGDNPAIFFLLLTYAGVGAKLVYFLYYYETANLEGMLYSAFYILLILVITYGIITYHSLAYLTAILFLFGMVLGGMVQLAHGGRSLLVNFDGWLNLFLGLLASWLLWLSRHNYLNLPGRTSRYR